MNLLFKPWRIFGAAAAALGILLGSAGGARAQSNTCITLFCPANITVATCSNCIPVSYSARAADVCCSTNGSNGLTVSYNPPPGTCFPLGTSSVQVTATDNCQNTATCSFTVTVNQAGGLLVLCPTNKTVSCGSNWTFDTPRARSCCTNQFVNSAGTLTNIQISSMGVVSNGYCPTTYTETWEIVDACGDTNMCSQSVTVIGAPATIVCPTNKTVHCTDVWTFDPPTVTGGCGASNVVMLTPVTNGTCPVYITATWQITDACGNFSTCSQVVGVMATPPTVVCPTNKSVPCGTVWTFDPPTFTGGCMGSNIVTAQVPVTNGICPQTITETWVLANTCYGPLPGCSQTVTVVDTTPPFLACPAGPITVPLNNNCQLVIPPVILPAGDNCTPSALIVQHQTPAAGTVIVSGHTASVTVSATDLCGNSSSCAVQIVGVANGPILSGPTSLTVTNCLVPCVLPLMTVSDSCCPAASVALVQSPPCNAPFGPGINSVTVKATDCNGMTAVHVVNLSAAGSNSFLGNLQNTGSSNNVALLAYGANDPAWPATIGNLTETNNPYPPVNYNNLSLICSQNTVCHSTPPNSLCGPMPQSTPLCYIYTPWGLNSPASEWISVDYTNNVCLSPGVWACGCNFNLPPGANPATASISGRWAADDTGDMYFNGYGYLNHISSIGSAVGGSGYQSWHSFTIPPSAGFVATNNSITLFVSNSLPYTGVRMEFTNAMVGCYPCVAPAVVTMTPGLSLPQAANATFQVVAAGTPPLSYQWYFNAAPITNNAHYSGATNNVLQVNSLGLADAGNYSVQVTGLCGSTTAATHLLVFTARPLPTGFWNVGLRTFPLAATVGPDLNLASASFYGSNYTVTAGDTMDFGLPTLAGQVVNVMDIAPLPPDTAIEIPALAPAGAVSAPACTVVMDICQPESSYGTPATLFHSPGSGGASGGVVDGVSVITDSQNILHLTGALGGAAFDAAASSPLLPEIWNRLAFVINPLDAVDVSLSLYVNGVPAAAIVVAATNGDSVNGLSPNWQYAPPTFFSSPGGATAEFYVASLEFMAGAYQSAQIAGLGDASLGPLPVNDTMISGPSPLITAVMAGQSVTLGWTGAPYALQETDDLSAGLWTDSDVPVTESQGGTDISCNASINPASGAPARFYRLVFRP